MQPNSSFPGKLSGWRICTIATVGLALAGWIGCSGSAGPVVAPKPRQAFAGVVLKIGCADAAAAREIVRRTTAWCNKTGARVEVAPVAECEVAVISPAELGVWMARKDALPVPDEMRNSAHAVQWSRCLAVWSDRLASWGGTPHGIPIAGDGYVLAYNADKFVEGSKRFKRPIAPPATWEDFAELAELFAKDGTPSLPALPADPDRALREFQFVAACYDRPALTGTDFTAQMQVADKKDASTAAMLSFYHDIATGEPRLNLPAFLEAAKWWKRTAACRAKVGSDSAIASVAKGQAVMGVVSLAELGQLAKADGAAPAAIGLAPLPGTKVWYDAKGSAKPPADKVRGVNFVPYFGTGGWIGVVRPTCTNPEAAFELLAEVSSLDRSTELLSDPTLGFGPFRVEHLDQARESVWQRYGFDAGRSQQLAQAIRLHTGSGLANPAVGLRGVDRTELLGILAGELAKVASGTTSPEDALKAADAAWRAADAKRPAEELKLERRQAAGLR